jgi:hypothetical protein
MGGPPEPREARSAGKLHDPPIQGNKRWRLWLWMAGSEAGHGELGMWLEQRETRSDFYQRFGGLVPISISRRVKR